MPFQKGHRLSVGKRRKKRAYKNGAKKNLLPDKIYMEGFLHRLDFRMEEYVNMAKCYAQLISDLGGVENLSRIEQSLIERFVFVEYHIRKIEMEMIKSQNGNSKELVEQWQHYNNAINSIAAKLGTTIRKPKGSKLKKHLAETYVD